MRFSHIFAVPTVTLLVAAHVVPRNLAQLKSNLLESRQSGASTRNDPRPQKGNIPYGGAGVRTCTVPGTVAITFDDGPNIYTGQVLDHLAASGFKATFFINGDNGHGAIDGDQRWIDLIKRMDAEGHQVASHTWNHADLAVVAAAVKVDEMVKNEMGIRNILGKYPTYMRPPYGSCNDDCQAILKSLGYVIVYWDLDTYDYNNINNIQVAKDIFKNGIQAGQRIALAHDLHEVTATTLTPYMLQYLKDNGYRGVTVGECLGEAKENWYRPSQGSTAPPSGCSDGSCQISTNGLCGSQGGATCAGSAFGNCCSTYGYCGSSSEYCGANCNPAFGTCGTGSTTPTPVSSSRAPTPTPTQAPPTGGAPISAGGLCGVQGGETCAGSVWGSCCSQWGYCGSDSAYCGSGCNKSFGTCS